MPLHVVMMTIPAQGHVNPALGVAEELVRRGHRVSFLAVKRFEQIVHEAGAVPVPYTSAWPDNTSSSGQATPDEAAGAPLMYLDENLAQLAAAEEQFAADRPDVVVFDSHMTFAGRALVHGFGVPSVVMHMTLASNDEFSLAQEMTARFEGEAGRVDPRHPDLVLFARKLAEFMASHDLGVKSIAEFELDPSALKLVFTTREFQIRGETFGPDYVFAGPCVPRYRRTGSWQPAVRRPHTVLISMGTQVNDQPELFRAGAAAFDDSWQVVIVIGRDADPAVLGAVPDNVEVHTVVPQPLVLPLADAFVSHGGMNSTMEALAAGVPLVVAPMTPEQELIAEQVGKLGLGRTLNHEHLGRHDIHEAVIAVAADPAVRQRISEFRERLIGKGAPYAADEIEKKVRLG